MFTIIISEKGGAERREAFDRSEINVGRVQGNDLMLPKGNVSKHHARLLSRDGRFIVTDLKSTNGTYVNGRKISQATIVREGDKIYIGDFVLRLETGQGVVADGSGDALPAGAFAAAAPDAVAGGPPPVPAQGASAAASQAPPVPPPLPPPPEGPSVSHYPLERDPDSESAPEWPGAPVPKVPAPPRIPQSGDTRPRAGTPVLAPERAAPPPARAPSASPSPGNVRAAVATAVRAPPRETPQQAARRLALITLVDRVADTIDLSPLDGALAHGGLDEAVSQQVERAVREQAKAMRDEGEAPDGIDFELLARDALRELVGLGPIGPLLEDDEASEIHVVRPDYVLVVRGGEPAVADPSFTSDEALRRVVARLAQQSGDPVHEGELLVERRLARSHMVAIAPPASMGWVLTIRKRRRFEGSLEELVRTGAMSRSMAAFLEACMLARSNVLVVGSGAGAVASTIGALASTVSAGERIAMFQDTDEIPVAQAQVVELALGGPRSAETVHAAARLGTDRLLVVSVAGHAVAAALVDAIADGSEGVIAGLAAPSMRHGLARLAAQISLARPGASIEAAREAIGESFDVAVEVVRTIDGRLRVLRVAELAGADTKGVVARDLFQSTAEGASEPAFVVTGTIPRLAHDFAARGIKLDAGMFKRVR
jgi:pilus assembly protein CpaF